MEKIAGSRFIVYDKLLSVALDDPASPTSLITKVDDILRRIKGLRPDGFNCGSIGQRVGYHGYS